MRNGGRRVIDARGHEDCHPIGEEHLSGARSGGLRGGFLRGPGNRSCPVEGDWKDPRTWKGFSTPQPRNPAFDPLARFEAKNQDTWNMCEWGAVYRAEQAERPGRIGYLRPAVVAQVIVSFRDDIQEPHDLAGLPVGVGSLYFGNHYNTLELLEGPLRRDQIVIDHDANHLARGQAGDLAAVTVMEPFVRQMLKRGAHVVTSKFYRGAQIFADHIPLQDQRAYMTAVNQAVDLINADRSRYRSYIVEWTEGEVAPEELTDDYYRYTHAAPIPSDRFDDIYSWMQSWNLADGTKTYREIVNVDVVG